MNKHLMPRDFYNLIADSYDERYEEFVNSSRTKKQVDFIEQHLALALLFLTWLVAAVDI